MYKLSDTETWSKHLQGRIAVHNINVEAAIPPSIGFQWRAVRKLRLSHAPDILGYQVIAPSGTLWLTIQEFDGLESAIAGFKERLASTNTSTYEPFNANLEEIGDLAFVDLGLEPEGPPLAIVFLRGNLLMSLQGQGKGIDNLGSYAGMVDRFFGVAPVESRKPDSRLVLDLSQVSEKGKSVVELAVAAESIVKSEAWIRIFSDESVVKKEGQKILIASRQKRRIKAEAYAQVGPGTPMHFKLRGTRTKNAKKPLK